MAGSIHQDKRTGKWFYTIEIGRDPITGRRKQRKKSGFESKTEARKAMIVAEKDFNEGILINPSKILIKDFLHEWLETKTNNNNLGVQTAKVYKDYIKNYIIPSIGGIYLADIKKGDIQSRLIDRLNKAKYSPATIAKAIRILKTALDYAVDFEYLKRNPCTKLVMPKKKRQTDEIKVWDSEQVNKFLQVAREYKYFPIFHLALNTGMRQQEILGLPFDNVNFDKGTISIKQVLSHDGKQILKNTKTDSSERTLNVSEKTLEILRNLKEQAEENKVKHEDLYQDQNLVFCSDIGTPINPRNLLRSFYDLTKKADLPKITFHDLRHSYATLLLENGANVKVISDRLGHGDIKVTLNIYLHVTENMQNEAVNLLDNILNS